MKFERTSFRNLLLCHPAIHSDERGLFFESFRSDLLDQEVGPIHFCQDNESISKAGVLRGLHFQVPPMAQDKLVRVVRGSALDVAVDLRTEEPTYGKYFSLVLSGSNRIQLFIPKGFAHGFLSLEDDTVFSYKCSARYSREYERSLLWNDSGLNIDWGITHPQVSNKDRDAPSFNGFNSPF